MITNALCNINSDDVFTLCCYDEHIICYFFPPKSSKKGISKEVLKRNLYGYLFTVLNLEYVPFLLSYLAIIIINGIMNIIKMEEMKIINLFEQILFFVVIHIPHKIQPCV